MIERLVRLTIAGAGAFLVYLAFSMLFTAANFVYANVALAIIAFILIIAVVIYGLRLFGVDL